MNSKLEIHMILEVNEQKNCVSCLYKMATKAVFTTKENGSNEEEVQQIRSFLILADQKNKVVAVSETINGGDTRAGQVYSRHVDKMHIKHTDKSFGLFCCVRVNNCLLVALKLVIIVEVLQLCVCVRLSVCHI